MTNQISLQHFIRLASAPDTQRRIKILKNGNMVILDLLDERTFLCFSKYYRYKVEKTAEFAYWVLREVVHFIEKKSLALFPITCKKVRKVSLRLAQAIRKEWHNLDAKEKEYFIDLPNRQSLLCTSKVSVQETEGLHFLNTCYGTVIGSDLDRLIHLENLILYSDKLVLAPSFLDTDSILELIEVLCENFQLPHEIFDTFINLCRTSSQSNVFERIFGKAHFSEELIRIQEPLKRFLMGTSQFHYQHTATILSKIFKQKKRIKFADGSHDNVAILIHAKGVEVRHFFTLYLKNQGTIIRVDTVSHFRKNRWISNRMTFLVQSKNHILSAKEKKMQKLLKSFGY